IEYDGGSQRLLPPGSCHAGHLVQARWRASLEGSRGTPMDPRFSALPDTTQLAVEECAKAGERARQALRTKQVIADRARVGGQAAAVRADRLQAEMSHVRYATRP